MMLAIVQRPRRKQHLAVTHPGMTEWDTLGCARSLPMDGTAFVLVDQASGSVDPHDDAMCVHCRRLLAFAHALLRNPAFTEARRPLRAVS